MIPTIRTTSARLLVGGALILSACSSPTAEDPARVVPANVGAAELRADIAWLSADARLGRATGTPRARMAFAVNGCM